MPAAAARRRCIRGVAGRRDSSRGSRRRGRARECRVPRDRRSTRNRVSLARTARYACDLFRHVERDDQARADVRRIRSRASPGRRREFAHRSARCHVRRATWGTRRLASAPRRRTTLHGALPIVSAPDSARRLPKSVSRERPYRTTRRIVDGEDAQRLRLADEARPRIRLEERAVALFRALRALVAMDQHRRRRPRSCSPSGRRSSSASSYASLTASMSRNRSPDKSAPSRKMSPKLAREHRVHHCVGR